MNMNIRLTRMHKGLVSLFSALSMAACSAAGPETAVAPAPTRSAEEAQTVDLQARIGILPPQELQDGACGMFLWARGSRANLVFFTSDTANQAHIVLDGEEVLLPRTQVDGDFLFGQYMRQRFGNDMLSLRLAVQPDPQSRMIGGTVVRQGTLSFEDNSGWNLVLPVAGIIACKSA